MAVSEDILFRVIADITKSVAQLNKFATTLDSTAKSAKRAGDEAGKAGKSATPMFDAFNKIKGQALAAAGVLVSFGVAAKKAFDFGLAGAQVKQLSQSFDTMAQSIGAPINLIDQMRTATRGTVSDFDLMRGATVAMIGVTGEFGKELSASIPKILEIAKAAEKANPSLGDTGFLFNSLTVGLKRLSPRLIDNTGLQVKYGESLRKFAEEAGKTTQELTAMEQQQALLRATLEAGDVLINQVGGSTESLTDVYREFSANIENTKNELAAMADVIVRRVVTGLNALLFGNKDIVVALKQHSENLRNTQMSYSDYRAELDRVAKELGFVINASGDLVKRNEAMGAVNEELIVSNFALSESVHAGRMAYIEWTDGAMDAADTAEDFNIVLEEQAKGFGIVETSISPLLGELDALNARYRQLKASVGGDIQKAQENLAEAQDKLAKKTSKVIEKLGDIANVDLSVEQYQELAGIFEELETANRQLSGTFSTEQSKIRTDIASWTNAIRELRDQEYVSKDDIGEIARLERKIREAGQAFGESLTPAQAEAGRQVTELIAKIQEISGLAYWTPKQQEELQGLIEDLGEAQGEFDEVAEAAKRASQSVAFENLGRVVEELGKRADEARKIYEDALKESGEFSAEALSAQKELNEANDDYLRTLESWEQVGIDFGFIDEGTLAIEKSADELLGAIRNTEGWNKELEFLLMGLLQAGGLIEEIPEDKTLELLVEAGELDTAKSKYDSIKDKTVTISVVQTITERTTTKKAGTGERPGFKQHGGAILPNRPVLVGEKRPEIFTSPVAGRIIPPGEQDRMMNQNFKNEVVINANVESNIDIEFLARRVADVIFMKQKAGVRV